MISIGMAQHISAGSGVRHSEVNGAGYTSRQTARIIQSWLPADAAGTTPSHKAHDFNDALSSGEFIQVADPDSPLLLGTEGASMWVARLSDSVAELPGAPFIHLYLVSGNITAAGHNLAEGDVLRAQDVENLTVEGSSEVLAWVMQRKF